jgi:hypothetical protein
MKFCPFDMVGSVKRNDAEEAWAEVMEFRVLHHHASGKLCRNQ